MENITYNIVKVGSSEFCIQKLDRYFLTEEYKVTKKGESWTCSCACKFQCKHIKWVSREISLPSNVKFLKQVNVEVAKGILRSILSKVLKAKRKVHGDGDYGNVGKRRDVGKKQKRLSVKR